MPRDRGGRSPVAIPDRSQHEAFMRQALEEARRALHLGEVPVGAVLVHDGAVVATGFNQPIHAQDPTAHAEVQALRHGARALGNYRLLGTTLYVTVEPCLMCVGALVHARVSTLVYGADEPKGGALRSTLDFEHVPVNHRLHVVSGILEEECRRVIQDFFRFRREDG
jgi:tRNA(adenine34) deaminase